jgi:Fe-Mn family superoxide dismutase
MQYTEQSFNLPELKGLSQKQIDVHLKLYAGYVKNVNAIASKIEEYKTDSEGNAIALSELKRRLGFEWNGMRLHELYFEALGGNGMLPDSDLKKALEKQYGSFEKFIAEFRAVGMMRGIGWTLLTHDKKANMFHTVWVSDHEVGHLSTLPVLIAMDMWEHAYMVDYVPAQKNEYIEAFLSNLNWEAVGKRF